VHLIVGMELNLVISQLPQVSWLAPPMSLSGLFGSTLSTEVAPPV
jgi:hypothetical protein